MKFALVFVLLGYVGVAVAQDLPPEIENLIPPELRNMQPGDPRAKRFEPLPGPGVEDYVIKEAMGKPPQPCFDYTATPRPLPNGNDQYPVKACVAVDYMQGYQSQQSVPTALPVQGSPVQQATPVAGQGGRGGIMDLNTLQMQRLGQLDAMQGKPINMQYANTLGYMQGFVNGQTKRAQAPMGGGVGGGFGGFGQ